jgi:hemoglobin-like flavoprotein
MTPDQKNIVRQTFALIEPRAEVAALLFYQRLFNLDPSLRPMFRGEVRVQGKKLMQALQFAVANMDAPKSLLPALQAMGQRHVSYGVRDEHYETVGSALLWTLEEGLGKHFTPEAKEAWATVYNLIATTMKTAAAEISPASASKQAA